MHTLLFFGLTLTFFVLKQPFALPLAAVALVHGEAQQAYPPHGAFVRLLSAQLLLDDVSPLPAQLVTAIALLKR